MASQVVLFAEEDNMFRLMEAALNGVASPGLNGRFIISLVIRLLNL